MKQMLNSERERGRGSKGIFCDLKEFLGSQNIPFDLPPFPKFTAISIYDRVTIDNCGLINIEDLGYLF